MKITNFKKDGDPYTEETWRPVPNYPDYYISSFGRAISLRRLMAPRLLKGHVNRGHREFYFCSNGRQKTSIIRGSELVMTIFVGAIPEAHYINHLNGDTSDDRLGNLEFRLKKNYQAVLDFIVDYKIKNDGVAPSNREVIENCPVKSTSHVGKILRVLQNLGLIHFESGQPRSVQVVGGKWVFEGNGETNG